MTTEDLQILQVLKSIFDRQNAQAEQQLLSNDRLQTVGSQLAATARSTLRIADAVTFDDRTLVKLTKAIEELVRQKDPARMSPEELAAVVDFDTLCTARQLVWKRKSAHINMPMPLPPIPNDLVPHTAPARNDEPTQETKQPHNRRKGDSISTYVDKRGKRRFRLDTSSESIKSALKWLIASGIGAAMLKALQHAWGGL